MLPMSPADTQAVLAGADAFNQPLDVGYRRALETIANATAWYVVTYDFHHHEGTQQTEMILRNREDAERVAAGQCNANIITPYVVDPDQSS